MSLPWYSIALKEASETRYWIEIMIQSETISEKKFSSMIDEINRIIRPATLRYRRMNKLLIY
jgi:four helix bundle protein